MYYLAKIIFTSVLLQIYIIFLSASLFFICSQDGEYDLLFFHTRSRSISWISQHTQVESITPSLSLLYETVRELAASWARVLSQGFRERARIVHHLSPSLGCVPRASCHLSP